MKRFLAVILSLTVLPFFSSAAQTVTAKMVCQSVRLQQGVDSFKIFTLDVSSYSLTDPATPPNGELLRYSMGAYTHAAYFAIDDGTGFDPITGMLSLNMPSIADTNTGMNAFFEVSQGISATSSGTYTIGPIDGGITATWTRQAGSASGTCQLDFGSYGVFTHTFSILEYSGPLTYTPGSNIVSGTIAFTNSADPSQWMTGSVQFAKSASNPADALTVLPFSWTNSAGLAISLSDSVTCPVYREGERGTNYYAFIELADGDLNTPGPDYTSWFLYFTDLNDSDHNGIPDFSDVAPAGPPAPPSLSIFLGTDNAFLSLTGAPTNSTCTVLQASDLSSTNWTSVQSLTVTSDPQLIVLPFTPTNAPTFWRVQVQ